MRRRRRREGYIGDNKVKSFVRGLLHQRVWELQDADQEGHIIMLCGPDAGDMPLLKMLCNRTETPPGFIHFVDIDPKGLLKVKNEWPAAKTHEMDICKFLSRFDQGQSIRWVHLDFCGHLGDKQEECLKLITPRLDYGSILSYTFIRGRESRVYWKKILDTVNQLGPCAGMERLASVHVTIQRALERDAQCIYAVEYVGHKTPMCTVAYQLMPEKPAKGYLLKVEKPLYLILTRANEDKIMYQQIMYEMTQRPPTEVQMLYNLTPGQLMAYKAHHTMRQGAVIQPLTPTLG